MPSFLGSVDQRTRDTIKYARKTYKEAALRQEYGAVAAAGYLTMELNKGTVKPEQITK